MNKTYRFANQTIENHRNNAGPIIVDKTVKIDESIKGCYYISKYESEYIILYENSYVIITSPRNLEFESLFPCFPYYRDVYNFRLLEQKINTIDERVDRVASHLEALIIGLGQRKASEESLDI